MLQKKSGVFFLQEPHKVRAAVKGTWILGFPVRFLVSAALADIPLLNCAEEISRLEASRNALLHPEEASVSSN